MTFLDVEGETLIVSIYSRAIVLDDFVPEAQKVLDTVKWGGS